MARKKKNKIEWQTTAEPRATIDNIPVFCAFDDLLDIQKAVENPRNPQQHPEKQIKLLAEIIKSQGWRNSITISTRSGFIVKGHGRLKAARLLGIDKVPVEYQNYESDASEWSDLTADNRINELAEIDNVLLADILSEIDTGEFPLEMTGYTEDDLEGILDAIAGTDDADPNDQDQEMEQPTTPMCKPGDLWELGGHRLIIGDATDEETVNRLMNGEKAAMVHTDPPYGVSYNGGAGTKQKDGTRKSKFESTKFDKVDGHDNHGDDLLHLLIYSFRNMRKHTTQKAAFYIWHAAFTRRDFEDAMIKTGITEKQYLIWYKDKITLGRSDYQWCYEPCFYATKDDESPNFYGDRKQESVLTVTSRHDGAMDTVIGNGLVLSDPHGGKLYISRKAPKGKKVRYIRTEDGVPIMLYDDDGKGDVWQVDRERDYFHPTQKPVELVVRAIENSSKPGEIVMDLFGGSGSTLIGAERTGRRAYCTELDPQYGDVIVSRYVQETGNIGVTCTRDGKEMPYIDLVRQWAKDNDKEKELEGMKTPIVVVKARKGAVDDE